jgi:acyl carrier protein
MVRDRVVDLLVLHLGRVDEELIGSGLVDSLRAISLALTLEKEFGVVLDEMTLEDMVTLSSLSDRLHTIIVRQRTVAVSSSLSSTPDMCRSSVESGTGE